MILMDRNVPNFIIDGTRKLDEKALILNILLLHNNNKIINTNILSGNINSENISAQIENIFVVSYVSFRFKLKLRCMTLYNVTWHGIT